MPKNLILKRRILVILLLPIFLFSQSRNSLGIKENHGFLQIIERSYTPNLYEKGQDLLKNASNPSEKAFAYVFLGESFAKGGIYLEAIKMFQKSEEYAFKTDDEMLQMLVYFHLSRIYRLSGWKYKSDQKMEKMRQTLKNPTQYNRYAMLLQAEGLLLEIDGKFCASIAAYEKALNHVENEFPNNQEKTEIVNYLKLHLIYPNLKCGKIEAIRPILLEVEDNLKKFGNTHPDFLAENLYLGKALMSYQDNQKDSSRYWFDKAYETALKSQDKIKISRILQERLSYNLDTPSKKLELTQKLLDLNKEEIHSLKEMSHEFLPENLKEEKESFYPNKGFLIGLIGLGVVFLLILGNFLLNKFRIAPQQEVFSNSEKSVSVDKNDRPIHQETEKEILRQLMKFEEENLFTTPGITTTQMAVMLNTNTRYLTYILKKYKNSDFNTYINQCRIDYIVQQLNENPQLLQYKISALSEICGYKSHSQFW